MKTPKYSIVQKFILICFSLLIAGGMACNRTTNTENSVIDFKLQEIDISQLQQAYKDNTYSVEDIVSAYIERIKQIDQSGIELNSIIIINPDAIAIAKQLDEEIQQGKIRGPLHGIPIILKDNIDTHDKMPTTGGSRALANSFPLKDSYLVKKLRDAGAVILAKSNLSEWANFRGELSTSGWSGVGGLTKNPYVLDRNPCGSSSGSAVSVAANLTVLAIGTETDGSIVCPSNNNGIVGIKPTVGLISRSGIIPISFTQDTPGPMARTVKDAAICLGAMVGIDSLDSKTLESSEMYFSDYTQFLNKEGLQGKRLGFYKAPMGTNFKVDELMLEAINVLKENGAEIIEIERLSNENLGAYEFEVLLYEYKDGLNKYFESLGEKSPIKSIKELIEFNQSDSIELKYFNQKYLELALAKGNLKSKEYLEALNKMQSGIRENGIDAIMDEYNLDALISPTGSPAWKTDLTNGDHYQFGSSSPAAQAGYPNINVPMGFIDRLPVGISFFGKAWSEPILIEMAYAFEQATNYRQAPKFFIQ